VKGEYSLNNTACRRRLIDIFERFSRVYCCDIASFSVMGNHYHLLVAMDVPREMSRKELWKRAALLYPDRELEGWLQVKWERFEERIFDVSELMRSVNAAFARWYNHQYHRRGSFWAERFKSVLFEDEKAARDCAIYIELNAVRAGLVEKPEEYEGGSLYLRDIKKDGWMLPLKDFLRKKSCREALVDYKARVYYRGMEPTKQGQVKIPKWLAEEEEKRGFKTRGAYRKRLRFFADGVVLGSKGFVKTYLDGLAGKGVYKRRKNPIEYDSIDWFALRPQKDNG
jgi:REP element-mobilizing transposase RayT